MKVLAIALASLLATTPALAAENATGHGQKSTQSGMSQRGKLVKQLVLKWAPVVQESYSTSARQWAQQMQP